MSLRGSRGRSNLEEDHFEYSVQTLGTKESFSMPKKRKQKYKGNSVRKNIFLFLLAIGILLAISFFAKVTDTRISQIASIDPKDSLQIIGFSPTYALQNPNQSNPLPVNTPTPTKDWGKYCPPDSIKRPDCECLPYEIIVDACEYSGVFKECTSNTDCGPVIGGCSTEFGICWDGQPRTACVKMCFGKPVIYLYPEFPMFVNVEVQTTGEIFISEPLYLQGGWKQVFAEPSGKLTYEGKTYKELFYETKIKEKYTPDSGLSITTATIVPELDSILTKLGLNSYEKKEFMDFWVPQLKALHAPYIQFSLIQGKFKEKTDKIIISPKPDTFIEILAYFKPLEKPYQGDTLMLPENPPLREGFTAVEWGGK